ncbi:MAG TPA: glycosyltransferase family 2 protein [Flavobacteriaceae bacterium]|nr:glycosyltransferase family 2 protein [Flavobacteriaceae bacterium]
MKIAIVLLNWNGKNLLEKFLPKVIEYSQIPNAEIVLADNASTDDSIDFVLQNFPSVKIIKNKNNEGFAKGYNLALKQVKADIYCLLNTDVEVTNNWLQPILEIFKNEVNTAAVQPKILDYKNKSYFEYAGAAGGFIDQFGFPFCRGRIFNEIEQDIGQYNNNDEIFWASGACLFIRAKVFKEANGFDEDFFAHQEEIDLCWRINNLGYGIKFCSQSTVYHVGGATLAPQNPKKTYLNFRNNLAMMVKNLPAKTAFFVLFFRLFLDGVASAKFLFSGKPKHAFAILKSHVSFYRDLFKNINKRTKNTKITNYYKVRNIVWKHFVKGVNKFSEL